MAIYRCQGHAVIAHKAGATVDQGQRQTGFANSRIAFDENGASANGNAACLSQAGGGRGSHRGSVTAGALQTPRGEIRHQSGAMARRLGVARGEGALMRLHDGAGNGQAQPGMPAKILGFWSQ